MPLILNYPKRQNVAFSNTLFRLHEMAVNAICDEIEFDLSKTESLTPFGVIMLTSTITGCHKNKKKCKYRRPQGSSPAGRFLRESGFHNYFGLQDEQEFREIDSIQTGNVQLKRCVGLDTLVIDTLTEILDYHLRISPGVKGSFKMSLMEAMTNVIDHSGIKEYYVCCWNYPALNQIRLCIADLGMGIRASLVKSPTYSSLANDHDAIIKATEEGVSSRETRAGLGLSHIRKFLTVNGGQLCIISGHGKVFWKFDQGKTLRQSMAQNFEGTIIKLIINTSKGGFYFLSSEKDYIF